MAQDHTASRTGLHSQQFRPFRSILVVLGGTVLTVVSAMWEQPNDERGIIPRPVASPIEGQKKNQILIRKQEVEKRRRSSDDEGNFEDPRREQNGKGEKEEEGMMVCLTFCVYLT